MSGETHTKLTKLYIGNNASPIVYTAIKGVLGIPPVVQEKPEIDVTSLDSTAREYISGLEVGDELDIEFNWHVADTGQLALAAAKGGTDPVPFKVDFPDGTRLEFTAIVRSFGPGAAIDEQIKGQAKLKISGDVTQSTYVP